MQRRFTANFHDASIEPNMSVFLVTWNINKEKTNYSQDRTEFINHLNNHYTNTSDEGLESVRFISSNNTATQISDKLREKLDANDCIFVTKLVSGNYQGWLSSSTWDWINKYI